MKEYPLNIKAEIEYARRWAFSANPAYYNFENIGGDCTNFVSQCLYAGGAVMNYTRDTGWYYNSLHDRSAAWTSVEYFYKFIVNNKGVGPFGILVPLSQAHAGDVIQLGANGRFRHSLLVINVRSGVPYIAAHTFNAYDRPLNTYIYDDIRCIRIAGTRKYG